LSVSVSCAILLLWYDTKTGKIKNIKTNFGKISLEFLLNRFMSHSLLKNLLYW
jgi:hypothetical protein